MTAQTFLSALIVQKTGKKVCAAYTRTHERRHAHIEASMSTQIKGAHPSGQQRFWCPCAPSHTKACTHSTHTYAHTRTHTQAHTHKHTHTHTPLAPWAGLRTQRPQCPQTWPPGYLAGAGGGCGSLRSKAQGTASGRHRPRLGVLGRSRWGMCLSTQQGASLAARHMRQAGRKDASV